MFSSNEDKDDLATADIKYLRLPFLQAELLAQQHFKNHPHQAEARLAALISAQTLHNSFLSRVQQYEVLSGAAEVCVTATVADHQTGAVPRLDAATLRQMKIDRFRLEKSLAVKLEALEHQIKQATAAADTNKEDNNDGDDDDDDSDEAIESFHREIALLQVEASALKSTESLRLLRQEIQVLSHAVRLSPEERESQQRESAAAVPTDLLEELRKAAGALHVGSTAAQREAVGQGIFRPSHILPTLTVEQQGDIEVAQMMAQQRAEAKRAQQAAAVRATALGRSRGGGSDGDGEDEGVETDGGVWRQRAMDDWKDENPRGSGNSKLRPCG